ncbi:MAG: hypothetical protein RDV48_27720 [Candidatus Eremiobacteraeota bacterium]|nr:hypothetical protein [Candidatus Eremiobacteraeota bacterium]
MIQRIGLRAFTMIEVMLGLFLFLLCIGIIMGTFSTLSRTYLKGSSRMKLEASLRTTLDVMCDEIRSIYEGDLIITPQCAGASSILFKKYDYRKGMFTKVYYGVDSSKCAVQRSDYDPAVGLTAPLSTAWIGENVDHVSFYNSSPLRIVTISLYGTDPVTKDQILLQNVASYRSSEELLPVKATGKKAPTGSSTLLKAVP